MEFIEIDMDTICVSPLNVRKNLNAGLEDTSIDDLANSIKEQGLLSPVVVRTNSDGSYDLLVGQRRYLACRKLGVKTILATVRDDLDDTAATVVSLVENIQRADMNVMDKARAFVEILAKIEDPKQVARQTGVSRSTVQRYSKLLNLSPEIQDMLAENDKFASVDTLVLLAENFDQEDQLWVLMQIKGFNSTVREEILKASDGDKNKIPELVERALDGEFNARTCKEGLCFRMSDDWKAKIKEQLGTQRRLL